LETATSVGQRTSHAMMMKYWCSLVVWFLRYASGQTDRQTQDFTHLLRNCATLQTMICSEKLSGPRIICCIHYFHRLLLHHNITTSDIVPTHSSYLNI